MAPSRLLLLPSINAIRVWTRPLTTVPRPRFSFNPTAKLPSIVMANVTKANFWENCEQLETHLKAADFIALDFEMTGVEVAPWRRHSEMDTCETRYQHVKHSAESFAVWQCGICPFKWDEPGQKFIAYPYNFYIFPRNELPVEMTSRNYFCQTTSLEFLAKHHFDFNTTVYNGISYLSMEQEEIARAKLGLTGESERPKRVKSESESDIPLIKTADVVFSERVRIQVGQWRDGLLRSKQQGTNLGVKGSDGGSFRLQSAQILSVEHSGTETSGEVLDAKGEVAGDEVSSSLRPSYFVDIFGNNQARLVKQVLRKHFQDLVPVIIAKPNSEDRKQVRIIFTSSNEDKEKLMEDLEEENRRRLETVLSIAVGFRRIIDAIKTAGKPLVGHNCFLDLAHLHDKFLGPLPSSVAGFAASIRRNFPCVLDTKYLLKAEPTLREASLTRSTSLAIAYQELCQGFSDKAGIPGKFYNGKLRIVGRPMSRVKVEISSELQRYAGGTDTGLKHEAGFDAYMTGAVFAQLCHILGVNVAVIQSLPQEAVTQQMGLASYANLLMLQTFKGQSALDLSTGSAAVGIKAPRGQAPPPYRLPQRENVALLWGLLPVQGQEQFLREMVQNILVKDKRLANFDVYSVDGSSAFIEFRNSTILEAFLNAFQDSAILASSSGAGGVTDFPIKAARFDVYERICRSPLATESLAMAADLLGFNQLCATRGHSQNSKSETAAQARLEYQSFPLKSIAKGKKVNDSGFVAFEVGTWKEPELLDQEVFGRTESEDISTDMQGRIKDSLNVEHATPSDGISQIRIDVEETNGKLTENESGKDSSAIESIYSKWMKRVFNDQESGSVQAATTANLRLPKRPRSLGNKLGGRGAGSS